MKKKLILLFTLVVWNVQAGMSTLEALSMIESGDNDFAVGKAGEVSRYQLMPKTWRHYTKSKAYTDAAIAARIAAQHLAALETDFTARAGRVPTDFDRYVLWNAGPSYYRRIDYKSERVHPVIQERANRFVNLRQIPEESDSPLLAAGTRW